MAYDPASQKIVNNLSMGLPGVNLQERFAIQGGCNLPSIAHDDRD
jgi:hypothetical protein